MLTFLGILLDVVAYVCLFLVVGSVIFVRFFDGVVHMEYYHEGEEEVETQIPDEESQK